MAYCTSADMIARFGEDELIELTDRDNAGSIDDLVLSAAMDDASATIDSYIRGVCSLPLLPVPQTIKSIACDLAFHALHTKGESDAQTRRFGDAMDHLWKISVGMISLS